MHRFFSILIIHSHLVQRSFHLSPDITSQQRLFRNGILPFSGNVSQQLCNEYHPRGIKKLFLFLYQNLAFLSYVCSLCNNKWKWSWITQILTNNSLLWDISQDLYSMLLDILLPHLGYSYIAPNKTDLNLLTGSALSMSNHVLGLTGLVSVDSESF